MFVQNIFLNGSENYLAFQPLSIILERLLELTEFFHYNLIEYQKKVLNSIYIWQYLPTKNEFNKTTKQNKWKWPTIARQLDAWSIDLSTHFTIAKYLFEAVKLTYIPDPEKIWTTWLVTCAQKPKVPGSSPAASYVQRWALWSNCPANV